MDFCIELVEAAQPETSCVRCLLCACVCAVTWGGEGCNILPNSTAAVASRVVREGNGLYAVLQVQVSTGQILERSSERIFRP